MNCSVRIGARAEYQPSCNAMMDLPCMLSRVLLVSPGLSFHSLQLSTRTRTRSRLPGLMKAVSISSDVNGEKNVSLRTSFTWWPLDSVFGSQRAAVRGCSKLGYRHLLTRAVNGLDGGMESATPGISEDLLLGQEFAELSADSRASDEVTSRSPDSGIPRSEDGSYEVDEEEPWSYEKNEELLKKWGPAIGLVDDDKDTVGTVVKTMRNPASYKVIEQLEEGVDDVEELLVAAYGSNPEIKKLYDTVNSLIEKDDVSSARDIVEGNYVTLLEQMQEGNFGIEQLGLYNILASLYMKLRDPDAADQLLGQTVELLEDIADDEKSVDDVLEHTASLYMKLNNPNKALPLYMRSLSLRKASGKDIPSIVRTLIGLANTYTELNQGAESTKLYKQVLTYSEQVLGAEDDDLAAPLMHLASSLLEEDKFDEAELAIERAVKLTEKVSNSKDGRGGLAVCLLGQIKGKKGEMDKAVELLKKGLKMMEDSEDFKEPSNLDIVRMDLAALLSVMGRENESQVLLMKVSVIGNHEYFTHRQVEYLRILAQGFAEAGELEKAERALRRSWQVLQTVSGPDAMEISIILQILAALLHAQQDRRPEAIPLVREAIRIRTKIFGEHHLATAEAYIFLASILQTQDQSAEAVDLIYKVIRIQEAEYGFESPQLIETLEILNILLEEMNRYRDTVPVVKRIEHLKAQLSSSFTIR